MLAVARSRSLVLGLAVEAATVVVLHRLGNVKGIGIEWADPLGWLRGASTEEAVGGLLRLIALGAAWWLLATTIAYLVACAIRRDGLRRAVRPWTLPLVRRWVDRALAASLLATSTLGAGGTAFADDGPAPPTTAAPVPVIELDRRPPRDEVPPVPDVRGGRAADPPPTPPPATVPTPPEPVIPSTPAPAAGPAPTAPTASRHVVVAGDSLWLIATAHAGPGDVPAYWHRLAEANRDGLRSGNPNLIYPGEVIELPPR